MTLLDSLHPKPVDWTRGAGRARAMPPDAVDVVIPIYGAAIELQRCLESLAAHTDLDRHGVLLIVDGPQEADVESVLSAFTASRPSRMIRNDRRRGFAQTINRGIEASSRDVVLLNSDAIVTRRWVDKLLDAAYSNGDIGTVTPLSNHATLVSVPRAFEENLLPRGLDPEQFASLIERVSTPARVALPTAVGFCMFIRRALIDDIGLFDAARFAGGYGEEDDFCFRALERGWIHIADDATFVYHAGHRSFGSSRAALQSRAMRALDRLHPSFLPTIARFMQLDPLGPVRKRIADALRKPKTAARAPQRVVHLVHGWPPAQQAGTELYAHWLVRQQLQWREVSVYTRQDDPTRGHATAVERIDEGARIRLVTNHFTQRNPLSRNALRDAALARDFERFLREERPDLLHIHHLAGHAFSLARVAKRLAIPIVYQIQDWWSLCARVNLCDAQWRRCSGPALGKCARCAPLTKIPPSALWNRILHAMRRSAARAALDSADAYVMGSHTIRDDYARAGLLRRGIETWVLPYGIELAPRAARPPVTLPLRFGLIGSLLPHKGPQVAIEAFRDFDPSLGVLEIWGDASASPPFSAYLAELAGPAVTFHGTFIEEMKAKVMEAIDVLLVPSIGLESFGLVAREAMQCGVPVVATADGALAEVFAEGIPGETFPSGDAEALRAIVRRLTENPAIVDSWSRRLPRQKSMAEHALEIEAVYERVLAERR